MAKFLIKVQLIVLLISAKLFAQEVMVAPTAPAAPPGMRGVPPNIPNISVVGDFYGKITNNENDDERNRLTIREVELALQGFIYPEMRADVFFTGHKEDDHLKLEVDEAKVCFLRLFGNFSADVGKILVDFGKVNKIHQHQRPYVDQPQVITNFLGSKGLVGEGVALKYLFPLPFFAQINIGAWRVPVPELKEGEGRNEFGLADEVYSGSLWLSFPKREVRTGSWTPGSNW